MSNEISDIIIRLARVEDTPALLDIYAPYMEKTAISFEYDVPSIEEFRIRIETVLQKYPYLVAEKDGSREKTVSCPGRNTGRASGNPRTDDLVSGARRKMSITSGR
ncbi:MAG: GNAT family N-acetyltransferase [Lachnospiraceae bacterium]|nr:GNAT family N-acetyltransferase [Lachnospiraceae bacterium]